MSPSRVELLYETFRTTRRSIRRQLLLQAGGILGRDTIITLRWKESEMRVHLSSMYLAFILTIVLRVLLTAQVALPDTPAGKVAKQYIDAFNSGDDAKLRQFFIDNVAPKGLAERPVEARLERAKQFRQEAKSLAPQKILGTGPNSLGVVARAGNGDILTLTFE